MTKARDLANSADVFDTVTATELGYLDGVTSAIQTQIDGKQAVVANVDSTEIGYLDGVTSSIQTQLNSKAPTASPTFTGTVTLPSTTSIGNVSDTEIGYLDGVTSAIQTQINGRVADTGDTMTGTLTISTAGTSLDVRGASGTDVLKVSSTSTPSRFIVLKPETETSVAAIGYWNGSGWSPITIENGGATNTRAIRSITMSTSTPSGGSDGDVWIQYA